MTTSRTFTKESWQQHLWSLGKYALTGLFYAVIVLTFASLLSQDSADLAERVDRNAEIASNGVNAIICILQVPIEDRSDTAIEACLVEANFVPTAVDGG